MKKLLLLFVAMGTLTFFSCDRQEEIGDSRLQKNSQENTEKVKVMKEFAKLLGKTLVVKQNRQYLVDMIRGRNDNSEAITVNSLLGKKLPAEELKLFNRNKKTNKISSSESFKKAIITEVKNNLNEYPSLKEQLEKNKSNSTLNKSTEELYDDLSDYFAEQGLDVYFPYEENFNLDTETSLTTTWDPMTEQDTNSGYVAYLNNVHSQGNISTNNTGLQPLEQIDYISDNYAYENPTLVVRPATWIDGNVVLDPNPNPEIVGGNPPNWSFQGWQGFLTFNVDHTQIKDEDILKVNIPKIRLMEHLGTFFTPTTITLLRSSANLTTDNNNNLVFPLSADSRQLLT